MTVMPCERHCAGPSCHPAIQDLANDAFIVGKSDARTGFPTSRLASAAAGMVGGLVASWLMVKFQRHVWPAPEGDDGESSTTRLARELYKLRSEEPLRSRQAQQVGSIIHYGLGAGLGLAYGAAANSRPVIASGAGVPLGVVTELVFDQAIVPALGLSNPFWKCPVEWHVRGMAAHLVFGTVTEASRRLLLRLFDPVPNQIANSR